MQLTCFISLLVFQPGDVLKNVMLGRFQTFSSLCVGIFSNRSFGKCILPWNTADCVIRN